MKQKYIAWILPVAILYGSFYLLFEFEFFNYWWSVPTVIMSGGLAYVSAAYAFYLIMEDK